MIILLFFAFISGLLTILAPCIWPLLPIVLSASSTGEKQKPLGITAGIITSFALFTLTISYIVKIIPFDANALRLLAVVVIGFLGATLVVPQLTVIIEGMVNRFSGRFLVKTKGNGFISGFIAGFSLGIVWSPCAGPILATIATLAATRAVSLEVVLVTLVYVVGVGIPLFLFATVGARLLTKSRLLSKYTGRIQQIFGVIMILTALAIFTNYDKVLQVKLLDAIPSYSQFLYRLEGNSKVKQELDNLRSNKEERKNEESQNQSSLPNLGPAPEFVGINKWLQSEPFTMQKLRGKVVLIDFWTYTCINCIRTLPHVTRWYDTYKDKGFVVVGVHTPEFEFEKKTENVLGAIKQYNIHYPVAQDNDYATWNAYDNHYWPAEYLIDAKGNIRRTHFGEGEYEETEEAIRSLLKEAGQEVGMKETQVKDTTPNGQLTPETYLGLSRIGRFESAMTPKKGQQIFPNISSLSPHSFSYQGPWNLQDEKATASKGAVLELNFIAKDAYLVMSPKSATKKIKVFIDGKPILPTVSGKDIEKSYVVFDKENLHKAYHLVHFDKTESHILRLEFESEGVSIYAFTFG